MKLSWNFPYPSRRMPTFAKNLVATSQPLACQAGLEMLREGGNAVDAAIATAIALTIVEPTSNGLGGDAFAIIWDGKKLHALNGSGRAPLKWKFEKFKNKYESMPEAGWDTVTVPGQISAWAELSKRFGKLPFEKLFEPAIKYATEGFLVPPFTAKRWQSAPKLYKDFPEFKKTFLPNGKPPEIGEKFLLKDAVNTLELIAETGGETFYRGEISKKIVEHAQKTGGALTEEDLASHKTEWVETIKIDYRGITLHEIPPNTQGIAALIALGILNHFDIESLPIDSADSLHIQIEAMKLAFSDTYRYVSDPSTMDINYHDLLDPNYLLERSKLINMKKAQNFAPRTLKSGGTVYLTTADEDGIMVSFIQSNFKGFGSGIVIPETGISMNNRGNCFNLIEDHPNRVDGGKKPFHTIIPGFVMKNGEPLMSFGVMGGPMQPQGHLQIITRIFAYGQNPQTACDAPRWRALGGNKVAFEPGYSPKVLEELKDRGHEIIIVDDPLFFGGAQIILRLPDGYCGASDPRKDGQATGF